LGGEGESISYEEMNESASHAPIGSDGLVILPYGNGAERTLGNKDIGASVHGLNLNIHDRTHVLRAAQEGIVFALNYGFEIMNGMGITVKTIRAGHANMFLSPLFAEAFANTVGVTVELYNTDGAQGAARGAGIGAGVFENHKDAFAGLEKIKTIAPDKENMKLYVDAYHRWRGVLENRLKTR
jgi:xylulokinase